MNFAAGEVRQTIVRHAAVAGVAPTLLKGWRDFRQSGAPVRFLCFEEGRWADVAADAAEDLRRAFLEHRVVAEATYGGREFLFDFLRMARLDAATAEEVALGWIDERGACFFPAPDRGATKRKRGAEDEAESSSGMDERSGSGDSRGADAWEEKKPRRGPCGDAAAAAALDEGDRHCEIVSKLFLSYGMARHGAEITAVRKVAHGGRARAFQREGQLLAATRGGDAAGSAKFAWYGAPAEDVAAVVERGFERNNASMLRALKHGDGVHLVPPQYPHASAALAEFDETGEAHIVLCRVLMGRSEAVPAGSSQSRPSSNDYDSAVDNVQNPHWYIVWNKDMNTRILPEYVVSFKFPKLPVRGSSEATSKLNKPSPVARDMFPTLLAEIEQLVPAAKCEVLQENYDSFKMGRIKKDQFIRFLRNYIGDKVLTTVAKRLRGR